MMADVVTGRLVEVEGFNNTTAESHADDVHAVKTNTMLDNDKHT
jgi:hypothetical protein